MTPEQEEAEVAALAELEAMIERQRKRIDRYGIALMMIAEGCAEPQEVARAHKAAC
jgi:hypothetical protein